SVCAYISTILQQSGFKVGRYTSPHLWDFGERISIDGFPMGREEQAREISRIRKNVDALMGKGVQCTFFETTTAMAFSHFAKRHVDFAVVEVGMGGRLDSTNVLDPMITVITNVSKEHTKHLGKTVVEIAGEKAGIIKKDVPTVCASENPEVLKVVEERCQELGSKLVRVSDASYTILQQSIFGSVFSLVTPKHELPKLGTRLAGRHQVTNAVTAILAVEELIRQGVMIPQDAIVKGIGLTRWPARLQVVSTSPLMISDSTHNPGGARTLARFIKEQLPGRRCIMVLGMLEDKDADNFMRELKGLPIDIIATTPSYRRGLPVKELAALVPKGPSLIEANDVGKALEKAMDMAGGDDAIIISGSIFTASDALGYLNVWKMGEMLSVLGDHYGIGAYPGRDPGRKSPPPPGSRDPYRVLISTILSQRTRDENTHAASSMLFSVHDTPASLAAADPKEIEDLIRPAGFYKQKAVKIIATAKLLVERYDSKVPDDLDELIQLPGVGRKTANCVLSYGFDKPAIAVDTHVHRISNLFGLVNSKVPEETEMQLTSSVPEEYWLGINRMLVRHGQTICKPIKPRCHSCPVNHLCDYGIYQLASSIVH
ncbi:MAG: hypothetical protein KAX31_03970, partial [Thermoplasmata archaeon]|nr:hypothetical protein [Thermoplasmata archaeon]